MTELFYLGVSCIPLSLLCLGIFVHNDNKANKDAAILEILKGDV